MSRSDPTSIEHVAVQRLLPWLLTGTLDGAERSRVERHLSGCAACREDLAWNQRLRAAGQGPDACPLPLDADAALARLRPRLEPPPDLAPNLPRNLAPNLVHTLRRWAQALAAGDGRWLRPLAAAQFAAIALLASMLAARPGTHEDEARYRTLGAGAVVQGDLVVSFRPDTPERELRRILQDSGARVQGGPSVAGAWVLAAPAPARALARLRAEPAVTLAQPLSAAARP